MKNEKLGGIRKIVHEICKYILCCFEMRFCCRDAMRVYSTFCARVKFFLERTLEAPGVWRLQCH